MSAKPDLATRARLAEYCRQHPRDHQDGSGLGAMLVALGVVLAVGVVLRMAVA